ncbi:MAG TPA: double-strand break repair helicase AddA [Rhizomicrobium sp.]|nr:double-strand break repair helicase AddA [Rhizomicrobium sp.]
MTAQNLAADPNRSAWVSANAGAGKTYTLANRVTRLLLDGAKPERILCLTYTKAAAAEMAGRLFEQLGQWAMADDDELARRIEAIGALARNAQGLREARRLFALALETPGGLKIQTIHSFCQYLLARFPLEAGVPPSFRVLDDSSARKLANDARQRVLARAGTGEKALSDAATLLVTETSEMHLQAVLSAAFGTDRRKFERFLARANPDRWHAIVCDAHGAEENVTAHELTQQFLAGVMRQDEVLRKIAAWLEKGTASDAKNGRQLLFAIEEKSFDGFVQLFLVKDGQARKRLVTKALAEAQPALLQQLELLAAQFADTEARRRAAHAAALAHAAIVLAAACRDEYEYAKKLRSALDYDDLVVATERLLGHRASAQWVLYKLDGGLDHVLIDEAQDTSPEQWAIVKRLTEEFFAGDGRARSAPRTIFAVGDEKQSIFSFQGAEPREFDFHRRYFAQRIGEDAFSEVRLETSRRSAPEVLRFVDEVFSKAEARAGVVTGGEPIVHRPHREKARGRVELWPLVVPWEEPEPDPWRAVNVPSIASPPARLAERIARWIEEWTDGTKCLPGKTTPIRPGDIMVLTPRREPFASALIRALKQRGIPVAGADRIRLTEQIAVMDLVALGRFALLPEDDLNLAALLRSPFVGFSERQLYAVCEGRIGTLWREIAGQSGDNAPCASAFAFLSDVLARADFAPPYEFYAALLSRPGMRKRFLARLGAEAIDAIDEFLSLALAFESLNTPSLESFLHWIEHGDAEVKRDMERGRDEVRVMTVHGAKGLEADIVILPDTAGRPGGSGYRPDLLYSDGVPIFPLRAAIAPEAVQAAKAEADRRAQEEHRRLLYVALTRARDRLYICGFKGPAPLFANSWYALAERAAHEAGVAVARAGETVHALGEAEFADAAFGGAGIAAGDVVPEAWMLEPAAPERERPRLIRPSDAAQAEEPSVYSPQGLSSAARFRRGNLVHALLAKLPQVEPLQRHAAAEKYLTAHGVARSDAGPLIDETLAVIAHPEFAPAFAPTSRAELAIMADLPEIAEGARVSGRIDRLAISDTEVLAVDFKTNRPPPTRAQDVPVLYIAQMALYRAALAKIFPGRRIAAALVWTDGPSLMRLGDEMLDAEIARLKARKL